MEAAALLQALHTAERLKDATRHCYTSGGRHESVAEHSWRISLMAYWVSDEFPEADMNKVIRMCLIHDLGEAFTGDIPTFLKTSSDEKREDKLLADWHRRRGSRHGRRTTVRTTRALPPAGVCSQA